MPTQQKSLTDSFGATAGTAIAVVTFCALSLYASSVTAECLRDDVDYYLSKGFTQAQITALCGGSSGAERKYRAKSKEISDREKALRQLDQVQEDVILVKTTIAGWDVELNSEKLAYTRKFCVSIGKAKEVTARTKACPDVRFEVFFKNLKLSPFQRKYYFVGQRELEVKGRIKRTLLNPFSEYPKSMRRELLQTYKARLRKGGTHIPVRADAPLSRVENLLREYIARASGKE